MNQQHDNADTTRKAGRHRADTTSGAHDSTHKGVIAVSDEDAGAVLGVVPARSSSIATLGTTRRRPNRIARNSPDRTHSYADVREIPNNTAASPTDTVNDFNSSIYTLLRFKPGANIAPTNR